MGSNPTSGCMFDKTRAGLAFRPGTHAPRGPGPVISMRRAGEDGARRPAASLPLLHLQSSVLFDLTISMARVRSACWPHLFGGVWISFSKWLLYFRAGSAAPMHLTKDLFVTQRSRGASHFDIQAGGCEFDSRVEQIRASLPSRLLKGGDRNLILLVSCRCTSHRKLHRT